MRRNLNLNTVTLWAMWESLATYMQNWSGCKNLEQDNGSNGSRISITLTDKRDGNTYTVAKLKDGKCWMTQNLRIAGKTIDSTDSNINSGNFTIASSRMSGFAAGNNAAYVDSKYGGYYSWYTASAGYASGSGTTPNSICPNGWSLPSGNEFSVLVNNYGSLLLNSPANFVLNGSITNNQFTQSNWVQMYASTMSGGHPNFLQFNGTVQGWCGVGLCGCAGCYDDAGFGKAVRCISRK